MSDWIVYEVENCDGEPPIAWQCGECGEVVETKWNYCPVCGDPKTGKGRNLQTLIRALEVEHKKLLELQDKQQAIEASDCVSKRAVIDLWDKYHPTIAVDAMQYDAALRLLSPTPPDMSGYSDRLWKMAYERGKAESQPEIIHCKDCRYSERDSIFGGRFCHYDGKADVVKGDHYCGHAEGKTDE